MQKSKKLSIAYCKRILDSTGRRYTEEQIEKIRDTLYEFGELDYLIRVEMKNSDSGKSK